MIFKIKVFETDFEVHVDDEGAVTAAYTSDDVMEVISARTQDAIEMAANVEFLRSQRTLAASAKAEMLAASWRAEE